MAHLVTRYTIQRLTDRNGTEFYINADQWSDDADDAEEFRTRAKAERRADRVGGEVSQIGRLSLIPDYPRSFPQINHLQAAEQPT